MKTIIKFLIALAIVNAAARVGIAAAHYYELKDAAQELVTFGASSQPGEIRNLILQSAQTFNAPLEPGNVEVSRSGSRTTATVSYTQGVEVFPYYTYPINFRFSVDAVSMVGFGSSTNPQRR